MLRIYCKFEKCLKFIFGKKKKTLVEMTIKVSCFLYIPVSAFISLSLSPLFLRLSFCVFLSLCFWLSFRLFLFTPSLPSSLSVTSSHHLYPLCREQTLQSKNKIFAFFLPPENVFPCLLAGGTSRQHNNRLLMVCVQRIIILSALLLVLS